MRVYVKFPIIKNGGVSYPCFIFSNYLLVSFTGAIIITPSSSEVTQKLGYIKLTKTFLSSIMSPSSRISRWRDVTVEELRVFFGVLLHMGTIATGRLQDYWKTTRLFSIPFFSKSMSRDRFLLIMRCPHFARNPREGESLPEDRLFKIRPLIEYFNNKMTETYYPGKNLSLDESMILWRGRLSFRQYIKNKRHKYGIKLYV
jgi:hypothetical protein